MINICSADFTIPRAIEPFRTEGGIDQGGAGTPGRVLEYDIYIVGGSMEAMQS